MQLIVNEEFNDNFNNWPQHSGNILSETFDNGFYVIKNGLPYAMFYANGLIVSYTEYQVETRFKLSSDTIAYGALVWFSDSSDNMNVFAIYNNRYFVIFSGSDTNRVLQVKLKSDAINSDGFNVLKIRKKGDSTFFYINGIRVYGTDKVAYYGDFFGFSLSGYSVLTVDYLKFYQAKPEIAGEMFSGEAVNLGKNVNSPYRELHPIISPDGKTLYFVRDSDPSNLGDSLDQDIWFSTLLPDGSWSEAKNIGKPLNNSRNNSVIYVSPGNNVLYVTGHYDSAGNFTSEGISYSVRQKDGTWSVPKPVEIQNFYNKNIFRFFSFTPDRKVLLMSLERDDTYGGLDLYVSFLQPDGSYSEPQNMGSVLNTVKDDFAPYIAADGKTLYFASEGHPGFGFADIFVSKRLDSTWLHWSEPKNLGTKINSAEWEGYFTLDAMGKYAYIVSTKSGFGYEDIFRIKIPENDRPEPVVIVYGYVFDQTTNQPLQAKIAYTNLKNKEEVATAVSNPATGEYKLVLHYGNSYQIYAKKDGYFPLSDNLQLSSEGVYKEVRKDLFLVPVRKGQVVVLNNIYFPAGKATLLPKSYEELNRVYWLLKQYPKMRIEISGHTNNLGDREKLMQLSWDRANAVKDYLVGKGINPDRLVTKGYGPDRPIASNKTAEGRRKNQRVEFKILQM